MTDERLPDSLGRRLWPRFPPLCESRASCHTGTLGIGRNLAVAVTDISDTGVGLILSESLMRGEVVEVGLRAPGWTDEVRRMGVVVWAAASEGETCRVGVHFSERLGPEALRDLCRQPEP